MQGFVLNMWMLLLLMRNVNSKAAERTTVAGMQGSAVYLQSRYHILKVFSQR